MSKQPTISELREKAQRISVGGYCLEQWPDGTLFIESPSGEGAQVPSFPLSKALEELFGKFF